MPLPALDWDLWANTLCQMSHFLISCVFHKPRLWEKSSYWLLPEPMKCSTPDFTFLSQAVISLTFTIFVAPAATSTCNTHQNKEELALDHLFLTPSKVTPSIIPSVHTTAERVWDMAQQVAPCLTVLILWQRTGICHAFLQPISLHWIRQWEQKVASLY